jgi:ribosomal 50S subunit-associated protein YjgA (DUF615 family)
MAFIKANPRRDHVYYNVVETVREDGEPRHNELLYIGKLDDMRETDRRALEEDLAEIDWNDRWHALYPAAAEDFDWPPYARVTEEEAKVLAVLIETNTEADKDALRSISRALKSKLRAANKKAQTN